MRENQELLKRLARLESEADLLDTELTRLNELLKEIGFKEGTRSLLLAAEMILREENRS